MNRKVLIPISSLFALLLVLVTLSIPARDLQAQVRQRTPTPAGTVTPGPSPTLSGPPETPEGRYPTPSRVTDLAPQIPRDKKITVIIRHQDGSYEGVLLPWEKYDQNFIRSLPPGDTIVTDIPPQPLIKMHPPTPQLRTTPLPSGGTPGALTSSSCTENPAGLSFRVSQRPSQMPPPQTGLGPVHLFYVEGTGFIPGERVNVVIKARVTGPATIATTAETVWPDSTFATSVGAAVSQPNMPFDLFVVHRRGVACVSIIAEQ